ncbi:hypothetical protein JCM19237_1099 [Photobacterium aphoticum]|uniref:Sel1 repeat family protein n=1 Tax=Photobacterium aphoticum TaxID=754436 RepID=A0A090RA05_9GAMM|nr:hypothetical protein JCM19237_1099 [Photobacterium aphoticum]
MPFYSQKKYKELYGDIIENGGYGILTSPVKVNDNNDVINYLLIAANDGYPYAMVSTYNYYDFFGKEEVHKWIFNALDMGYYRAAEVLYYFHDDGSAGFNQDYSLAYYYNKLATRLGSKSMNPPKTKEPLRDENNYRLKDDDGKTLYKVFVSQEQQDAMDEKIEKFLQRVKPNRYLDETTHELFRKFI